MDVKVIKEKLKVSLPAIFIAMKKKDTPLIAKILAGITIGYALSPIDLIPDFVPVLGYLDDLLILPLLVALTIRFIPKDVMEESISEAKGIWDKEKPKKAIYAIPIIIIYLLLFIWVIKLIFR